MVRQIYTSHLAVGHSASLSPESQAVPFLPLAAASKSCVWKRDEVRWLYTDSPLRRESRSWPRSCENDCLPHQFIWSKKAESTAAPLIFGGFLFGLFREDCFCYFPCFASPEFCPTFSLRSEICPPTFCKNIQTILNTSVKPLISPSLILYISLNSEGGSSLCQYFFFLKFQLNQIFRLCFLFSPATYGSYISLRF